MIYLLHFLLALTAFFVGMNGFLHGAKKVQIDAILSIILGCLLVAFFALFSWVAGVVAIVSAFVYTLVARPLASRLALRLLGGIGESRGAHIGLPPRALLRISQGLAPSGSADTMTAEDFLAGSSRSEKAREALIAYCEANEDIKLVMREFGVTRATILEIYEYLVKAGAGQWAGGHYVAASAVAYPHTLRYLLHRLPQTRDDWMAASFAMLMHFERGAPLK